MARKNDEIIFRRIRGRIVPIRVKKGDRPRGVATAGAGLGLAAAGGGAARAASVASKRFDIQAQRALGLSRRLAVQVPSIPKGTKATKSQLRKFASLETRQKSLLRRTGGLRISGAKLTSRATSIRLAAATVGGVAIAKGIEQATGREGGIIGDIGAGTAASAAVVAAGDAKIRATTKKLVTKAVKFALKARF